MTIEQQIRAMDWTLEDGYSHALDRRTYRAYQGGFKTLWRDEPEHTLRDVRTIKDAREKADKSSIPF